MSRPFSTKRRETDTLVKQDWCHTQVNTIMLSNTWTIKNYSYCSGKPGYELKSPTFSAGYNKYKLEWYLQLYTCRDNRKYVSLGIVWVQCLNPVNVNFEIYIVDAEKKLKFSERSTLSVFYNTDKRWDIVKFLEADEILSDRAIIRLPNDTLTILCEVTMKTDIINISSQSIAKQYQVPECQIIDNLGLLFENEKFCDVTLAVHDKEFRAHKVLLAAQSPVFSAMFEHDTEESKKNHVDIIDVDAKVLKEMLRFIYTGKVVNLDVMANDLLAAADKYELKRLKALCEEVLYNTLTCENVADILILADLYCSDQLKSKALDFMNSCVDVVHTEGFKSMINSHPHLFVEVFQAMHIKRFKLECKTCNISK
ncbi:PREDICTED: speckle-type POZ protein A-like [Vollenhovia emeryi]|uniref:speckle-type POZ protein A-like n=1 Tax=Vollenhovia emeryi TaxID=411798 RepID=UPI0005F56ED3|nr:PREDICTED: speckle-type POZ protein A-like [Vollenhovia emeryi]